MAWAVQAEKRVRVLRTRRESPRRFVTGMLLDGFVVLLVVQGRSGAPLCRSSGRPAPSALAERRRDLRLHRLVLVNLALLLLQQSHLLLVLSLELRPAHLQSRHLPAAPELP